MVRVKIRFACTEQSSIKRIRAQISSCSGRGDDRNDTCSTYTLRLLELRCESSLVCTKFAGTKALDRVTLKCIKKRANSPQCLQIFRIPTTEYIQKNTVLVEFKKITHCAA